VHPACLTSATGAIRRNLEFPGTPDVMPFEDNRCAANVCASAVEALPGVV
jgi:hypothetical protein